MSAIIDFTSEAYSEALRRVEQCEGPAPGIAVVWQSAQFDNVRGPDGQVVWKEVEPAHWSIHAMSLNDLDPMENQLTRVGELNVFYLLRDPARGRILVSLCAGQFHVQEPA